ncbi:CapA family protein [Gorillibacterium massiliense]|uniref:CapA family protein n=1 Tax=Gorillibacterium massiliense TaxID=1280390 RepID=UPI0004AC95CE|nr:CapA family protein [Gorillibacterium massiliense]
MKSKSRLSSGIMLLLLFVLLTAGCAVNAKATKNGNSAETAASAALATPAASPSTVPTVKEEQEKESRVSLAAIGDVLLHGSVWKDAKTKGGFDFKPMLRQVKPILAAVDITFANQESMMGGEGLGLSDYPCFNSPFEIGDALQDAGVDIVSMANNHTMDRREAAIRSAIGQYRKIGMEYVGTGDSPEDNQRLRIIERGGIKVAFLAYTYGTNGIPVPADKPYLVNLLDPDRLAKDIAAAKESADFVAVSMHFGIEYQTEENQEQQKWAQIAADAGADLVIGTHPHVLQPMDWVVSSTGKRMLAIYSLGNFLAAQEQKSPLRQIGGIAVVDLVKTVKGDKSTTSIENVRFTPTFISFHNWRNFQVVEMDRVTDTMLPGAAKWRKEIEDRMTSKMPELSIVYSSRNDSNLDQ